MDAGGLGPESSHCSCFGSGRARPPSRSTGAGAGSGGVAVGAQAGQAGGGGVASSAQEQGQEEEEEEEEGEWVADDGDSFGEAALFPDLPGGAARREGGPPGERGVGYARVHDCERASEPVGPRLAFQGSRRAARGGLGPPRAARGAPTAAASLDFGAAIEAEVRAGSRSALAALVLARAGPRRCVARREKSIVNG